ncbi:3-phosphoglycerate dehydrogenase [Streptomyces sp. SID8361]|uniref:NAD(P)-dependent oxidoreductase n=1 Tax=Streptomyces sp. MnatMP-M27 TaxID=1839768 RepID=UPI00081E94F4|nr:NAD(P)-dependent oxidoreductase [Streptomyces sp. MnatMP-M27]MYU18412.1 3-phosphoglycerate dehydrogenase [Streptomyces sp. SID8361]SCG12930.1 D-3-phosphoglycerate dehydrogenase [Streptomyces sp. MnatMP-M27]
MINAVPRASWRVLALPPVAENRLHEMFDPLGVELHVPATRDNDGVLASLTEVDIVIGDYTGVLGFQADAVAAAANLAFLQVPRVGLDSFDLESLTAAGVPVANTPGVNTRAVAEWALAATFDLSRSVSWADRRMREGGWPQFDTTARGADELGSRRVGILGMGSIGTEVMRLFKALGSSVVYWSRHQRPEGTFVEVDELLTTSDVIIVCLPLTPETQNFLNAERLALMKEGALLVNVARGEIAPDDAVLAALDSGRLRGAALDVYEQEPLSFDHPLRRHENVLLSCHTAGATRQSLERIWSMTVENVRAAVDGRPVANIVNGLGSTIVKRNQQN